MRNTISQKVNDDPILSGKICPYCKSKSQFVDSEKIYGKSYGMVYYCEPCRAWVRVHKGTDKALGRLANGELREWKIKAHDSFDNLWMLKMAKGFSKNAARNLAYRWLSDQLKAPIEMTHIGMFDVDQCKRVVELCKQYIDGKERRYLSPGNHRGVRFKGGRHY